MEWTLCWKDNSDKKMILCPIRVLSVLSVLFMLSLLLSICDAPADSYEPTGIIAAVNYRYDFSLNSDKLDKVKEKTLVKVGEEHSSYKLKKSLENIYSLGYFSEVSVDALQSDSGVVLDFILKPKLSLKEVKISGNKVISSNELLAVLKSRTSGEYAQSLAQSDEKRIIDLYKKRGYFKAQVETNVRLDLDSLSNSAALTFQVDEKNPTIINQMAFLGNRSIDSESLLRELKTKKSKIYRPQIVEEDLERLRAFYRKRGYIIAQIERPVETFLPLENKIDLLIKIYEGPKIVISGNREVDSQLIQETLSIYKVGDYSDSLFKASINDIKDLYAQKGYYHVEVEPEIIKSPAKGIEVNFRVREGKPTTIAKISFVKLDHSGSEPTFAKEKNLRKQMALKGRSFLAFPPLDQIFSKGLYDENMFIMDERAIELYYKSHGYRRARVEERSKEIRGYDMYITIKISENMQTKVNKVEVEGNREFTKEALLSNLETKLKDPFDDAKISKDKAYLRAKYAQRGYMYARIESRILPAKPNSSDSDSNSVDATFVINESTQLYAGHITTSGNNKTKSEVIKREILLKSGEPLDMLKLAKSQQRIYSLGFFSTVRLEMNEREGAEELERSERSGKKVVDLKWIVDEKNVGIANMGLGLGYNPSEGFRVSGELVRHNLLGRGWKISVKNRVGLLEKELGNRFETMFQAPYLFKTPAQLTIRAFNGKSLEYETDELRTGASSAITFPLRDFKGTIQYRFNDVRSVKPPFVQTTISSISASLLRDSRNDFIDPSIGGYNELGVEYADGIIGKSNFIKITSDNRRFFQMAPKVSIGFALWGGYAAGLKETKEITSFERFKAGGATTVRAYRGRLLGPVDEIGNNRGDVFAVLNSELRFPIYKKWRLGGTLFFDSGDVWGKFSDVDYKTLKMGVGAGLRVDTMIGPVRFEYAFPLQKKGNEAKIDQFTWAIGNTF